MRLVELSPRLGQCLRQRNSHMLPPVQYPTRCPQLHSFSTGSSRTAFRVRASGVGRLPAAAKGLPGSEPVAASRGLVGLVWGDRRGSRPFWRRRWTMKSTLKPAAELTQGHRVSADTFVGLLREEGFSLQVNARTIAPADGRGDHHQQTGRDPGGPTGLSHAAFAPGPGTDQDNPPAAQTHSSTC
ncbi:hypothetical protein ACFV1U_20405 [Streptomyces microflavus]|uniref:ISAzo13-like element transposase-related protein n=1 Tax=Streptomyces microflavus TaxID=1919 RepID=UPI0036940222